MISVKLEIQEGADAMHNKEFFQQYGSSTATTLRLVKPWFGSGRIIIGDSAFGSVKSLTALEQRGLFSSFIIKQCHSEYPKTYLNNWHETLNLRKERGTHKILHSTHTIN